jgi:hypothetical protein
MRRVLVITVMKSPDEMKMFFWSATRLDDGGRRTFDREGTDQPRSCRLCLLLVPIQQKCDRPGLLEQFQ